MLRERLRALGLSSQLELRALPDGAQVRVSGLVTHLQQPGTASGVVFVSLEDETGIVNVILWPQVFEASKRPRLRQACWKWMAPCRTSMASRTSWRASSTTVRTGSRD